MKNDILNLDVNIKSKKLTTLVSDEKSNKTEESLFDKILKNNAQKNDKVSISKNTILDETLNKNTSKLKSSKDTVIKQKVEKNNNEELSLFNKIIKNSNKNAQSKTDEVKKVIVQSNEIQKDIIANNKNSSTKIIKTEIKDTIKNKISTLEDEKIDEKKDIKSEVKITKNNDKLLVSAKETNIESKINALKNVEQIIDIKNNEKIIPNNLETMIINKNKHDLIDESNIKDSSKSTSKITKTPLLAKNNLKEDVNIDKNILSTTDNKSDKVEHIKENPLLNSLINDSKIEKKIKNKKLPNNDAGIKNNIKANNFLNEQITQKNIISHSKIQESKIELKKDSPLNADEKIKKSANILELKPSKIELINEQDDNNTETKIISKITTETKDDIKMQKQFLSNVFLSKVQNNEIALKNAPEIKKVQKVQNDEVIVNLEATTLQNINTKIVSARQSLNSFMSDMARKLYENYKPPVTSFKINLNPSALGSISIIIKSNKADSNISVSMNMSQSSTLEILEQNKSSLQSTLQKTFNSESNLSLDFNMQDNKNDGFENSKDKNSDKSKDDDEILNDNTNEEDDVLEENKDYM